MGARKQELERNLGRTLDDLAHQLLRYRVIRGPAGKLANSKFAWSFVSRLDRVRTRRRQARILRSPRPHHVGIIMDGNRRFAKQLGIKHTTVGHVVGQERLEQVLDWCMELDIHALTVYAFSTENFQRDSEETELLMELFEENFLKLAKDERIHKNRVRVRAIGHLELLPPSVRAAAEQVMEATKGYDQFLFNVAIAYGGRQEIIDAVRKIAIDVQEGRLEPSQVDLDAITTRTYVPELADPDFIIRTSGEERISNFLLWQAAYSELYFADVYWPRFDKGEFLIAIEEFQNRQRRFGK